MDIMREYRRWRARAVEDDDLQKELAAMDPERDCAAPEDRFYRDLAFGTGGLRGCWGRPSSATMTRPTTGSSRR